MVLFNYSTKEITAKIVYYGPGLCGKTTNLQFVYDNLPGTINKGKMLSLATKTDRTLFFDFLPIDLGTIRGMRTRLQLYTVPGQVFYNTTRKLVLKGADGVVFVADSQKRMLDANLESFKNLEENLAEHDMKLADMPMIIQFNKRDLPEVASIDELNAAINKHNAPIYEGVATTGIGVHETLKAITRLVLNSLKEKYADKREQKAPPAHVMATAASAKSSAASSARHAAPRPPAQQQAPQPPRAEDDDPFTQTPNLGLPIPDPEAATPPPLAMSELSEGDVIPSAAPEAMHTMVPAFDPDPFPAAGTDDGSVPLLEVADEPILELLDDDGGVLELVEPPETPPPAPELERFEETFLDAPAPMDATEEIFQAEMPAVSEGLPHDDTLAPIAIPSAPELEPESEGIWLGQDPADDIDAEPALVIESAKPMAHAGKPAPPAALGRFEDDRLSIPFEGDESLPISTVEPSAAQRVVSVPVGAQEINLPISLEIAGRRIDFQIKISLDPGAARLADQENPGRGAHS